MDPLLVCSSGQFRSGPLPAGSSQHYIMPFAQVLVRSGMRFDIDSVVTHVGELFPRDRLSAAQASSAYALGINEHRERVSKFFHDRPPDLVLRFPAIIEANDRASRRYIFFATPPRKQILHADYGNPCILELVLLRLLIDLRDIVAQLAH